MGLPLVLAVVGTDHHPFDRMSVWVDGWISSGPTDRARVFMQIGTSRPPSAADSVDYLKHDELHRLIDEAAVVVCHGGPATIFDCLGTGMMPVVVPRRQSLGEHVDDHQVRFGRFMEERGYVHVAETEEGFRRLVDAALGGSSSFTVKALEGRAADSAGRFGRLVERQLGIRPRPE